MTILLLTFMAFLMSVPTNAEEPQPPREQGSDQTPSQDTGSREEPNWPSSFTSNTAYLADLHLMRQELARFENDPRWKDVLPQLLATHYSFVGRVQEALQTFDSVLGRPRQSRLPVSLDNHEACDAVATILKLADQYQVIMVNEAHHVPMHRAFTIQLLDELHRKGFRYFAVEALSSADDALQTRGYPIRKSGLYLSEPVCADMVRIALRIGYQVVPYEFEDDSPPQQGDDPLAGRRAREEGQAKNLQDRILAKDPQAKILVHAGYSHISKKVVKGNQGELRFMALAFQTLTKINPLCIDQTLMTEHSQREKETAEYQHAIERRLVKEAATVLRHQTTKEWFQPSPSEEIACDLVVFHPRSRYENGRPTWLGLGGRRSPHIVRTDLRPSPGSAYLAQAFYEKEKDADVVPIDQMEYGPDEPIPTLWLPSGQIRVRIVDASGTTVHEYLSTLRYPVNNVSRSEIW